MMQNMKAVQKFWISLSLTAISAGNPVLLWGGAIALNFPSSAQAAVLTQWQFNPTNRQLEVTVPEGTTPRYFLLAQPARIVLDLPNTSMGSIPEQQTYSGLVRQIRVGQFEGSTTRIVIELSPEAVLAPRQVELRQVNPGRWVLRPLLAGETSSIAQAPPTPPTAPSPAIAPPPNSAITPPTPPTPSLAETVPPPPEALNPPAITPPAPNVLDATRSTPAPTSPVLDATTANAAIVPNTATPNNEETQLTPETSPAIAPDRPPENAATLPPLEPGAIEIPVTPPVAPSASTEARSSSTPEAAATTIEPPSTTNSPAETTSPVAIAPSTPLPPAETVLPPAESALPAAAPIAVAPSTVSATPAPNAASNTPASQAIELPPPTLSGNQPVTVTVPSIQATSPAQNLPSVSNALPPPTATTNPGAIVSVPPVASSRSTNSLPTLPPAIQTMPPGGDAVAVAPTSPVLLPEGTVLSLRYPRNTALSLEGDRVWQEVLILAQAVRDRAGNVILPEGSQVIGRFETGNQGSQFIAQAISIGGRNVLIKAESSLLEGEREVSDRRLVRNSAIGALALTVLGGFTGIGLLAGVAAGAAAGAATTYVTAPQPAIIQPNQILEVRLTEDVRTLQ